MKPFQIRSLSWSALVGFVGARHASPLREHSSRHVLIRARELAKGAGSIILTLLVLGGCRAPHPRGESPAEPVLTPTPSPVPVPSPAARQAPADDLYRVGPGDVLKITVFGEPEISGNFRVAKSGVISWAWVGEVPVAGKTIETIGDELREILAASFIRSPRLEVGVGEYRSQVVYFFGNVVNPGISRLGENRSLLQNLLQAGGPKVWGDSIVTVLRAGSPEGGQDKISLKLQALLRGEAGDLTLENGDIVTVVATETAGTLVSEDRVYIVGAVKAPGSFSWRDNLSALDILMAAGGLTDYASGNRARLVRGSGDAREEIRVQLGEILDGDTGRNILLQPGDLIIVPESIF